MPRNQITARSKQGNVEIVIRRVALCTQTESKAFLTKESMLLTFPVSELIWIPASLTLSASRAQHALMTSGPMPSGKQVQSQVASVLRITKMNNHFEVH